MLVPPFASNDLLHHEGQIISLVTDNSREIPFPIFTEFKVIVVVARYLGGHTFIAPLLISPGAASDRFLQVSPGPFSFIFIDVLQPFLPIQTSAVVREVLWHQS